MADKIKTKLVFTNSALIDAFKQLKKSNARFCEGFKDVRFRAGAFDTLLSIQRNSDKDTVYHHVSVLIETPQAAIPFCAACTSDAIRAVLKPSFGCYLDLDLSKSRDFVYADVDTTVVSFPKTCDSSETTCNACKKPMTQEKVALDIDVRALRSLTHPRSIPYAFRSHHYFESFFEERFTRALDMASARLVRSLSK